VNGFQQKLVTHKTEKSASDKSEALFFIICLEGKIKFDM